MFEDFLQRNYSGNFNKLRKVKELLDRLSTDDIQRRIQDLFDLLNRLDDSIQNLEQRMIDVEPEPEVPSELPDLKITSIEGTSHDHYLDLAITVKNIGVGDSRGADVDVAIGTEVPTVGLTALPLASGEETVVHHQYSFNPSGTPEEVTVTATVDPNNLIDESNNNNNTKTARFAVKSAYVPPAGKSYLIVHIHNPEGFEIGSILTPGDITLSHGTVAYNAATHGIPTEISPGDYTVTATFNGITLQQDISLAIGDTLEIFFTFPRTEYTFDFDYDNSASQNGTLVLQTGATPATVEDSAFKLSTSDLWSSSVSILLRDSLPSHTTRTMDYDQVASFALTTSTFAWFAYSEHGAYPLGVDYFQSTSRAIVSFSIISLDVAIAPQTFTNWYAQSLIEDDYPRIEMVTDDLQYHFLIPGINQADEGYNIETMPANVVYDRQRFVFGGADVGDLYINNAPVPADTLVDGGAGEATIKMSSIPYNLDGTAV